MPVFLRHPDHEIIVQQTIESVKNNSGDNYELIIINDGSPLKCGFLADEADVYINKLENQGIAPAWNSGMREAKGEYVAIVNDDIMVPAGWLEYMAKGLELYQDAGVMGPLIAGPSQTPKMLETTGFYPDHKFYPGYCFMFKKSRWYEEFDERFVPANSEDTDMWWRIMKSGLKLYRAAMSIYHAEGDVLHQLNYKKLTQDGIDRFIDKWGFDATPFFYGSGNIEEILNKHE